MNIFLLDYDPHKLSQSLCDQHLGKQILELAQLLSTVVHLRGGNVRGLYKPTHANHPCTKWILECEDAWDWLDDLALYLDCEYAYRFEKNHASYRVVERALNRLPRGNRRFPARWCIGWNTERFPSHGNEDPVQAYRRYYRHKRDEWRARGKEMTWTLRDMPAWLL